MKNKYVSGMRFLCFLLLICLVLPFAVSCDKTGKGGEEETSYDTEIVAGTEYDPKIPKVDYDGYEFVFLTALQSSDPYSVKNIVSEGEEGDLILDAVFRRNVVLEDKYNIRFSQIESADARGDVRTQVMSGHCEFDSVMIRGAYLAMLAREGLLYNLNELPWVDMEKPYWDQNAKKELAIGNALFFTNCEVNLRLSFGIVFNKQLIEDYRLTSPYQYMAENNWTLDTFGSLVKSISLDQNNDGVMDENDRYGATFEHNNVCSLLYASGIRATTNDESGYPELTLMSDKTVTAFEKIKDIFSDPNTSYCLTCSTMDAHGFLHKFNYARYLFTQDFYLFHIYAPSGIYNLADMEHEFGIVPLPKYDSSQDRYYSLWSYWDVLLACPAVMEDPDRTGRILEDLNYYSSVIVTPEWFDTMLSRKYARDDESEQSIRIIKDTAVFDMALMFDFGGIRAKILEADPTNGNISTSYAKLKKAIQSDIDASYSKFNQPG